MSGQPELLKRPLRVDPHVHLREPGENKAETIESGTRAAARGGVGAVGNMHNVEGAPVYTYLRLLEQRRIIARTAFIPVLPHMGSQRGSENAGEIRKSHKYF